MNFKETIKNYIPKNEQEVNDKRLILEKYIDMEDNILTRENEIAHFTCSSWITNKNRDKVIMIYHNIYDSWAWTGGHADGDSDFLNVAIKEAKEETGIDNIKAITNDIASIEILTVDSHIKRGKFVSSHLHLNISYLLETDEEELLKIKEDEHSAISWFYLDEALEKSTEPKLKSVYAKLNSELLKYSK